MIFAMREHEIACGHTVYQHESKCAHLHGHNYLFKFWVESETITDNIGRVIDFSVIKSTLCEWLEREWDHRFLVYRADPRAALIKKIEPTAVVVPFNPTAENMAEYIGNEVAPSLLPPGINVVRVEVWETRKCSAMWTAG